MEIAAASGDSFEPIGEIKIDIPGISDKCFKHKIKPIIAIGKVYHYLYFIPTNYFTVKPKAYVYCPKCKFDVTPVDGIFQLTILDYFYGRISAQEFNKKMKILISKRKKIQEKRANKENENFIQMLKWLPWIIGFLGIAFLIRKYIL